MVHGLAHAQGVAPTSTATVADAAATSAVPYAVSAALPVHLWMRMWTAVCEGADAAERAFAHG